MRQRTTGAVLAVIEQRAGCQRLRLKTDEGEATAVNYPALTGRALPGDVVMVNTVAVELGLGTGGDHFVVHNLTAARLPEPTEGHILKLRYTPLQTPVLAAAAPEAAHHERLAEADSLDGQPVVVALLHSSLAPICAGVKERRPQARIAWVMTDSGALLAGYSRLAARLRACRLLDVIITSGQAAGGEMEAVSVADGLLAARTIAAADVTVVTPGPGHVGTGTRLGFSGVEMASALDLAAALNASPIACLRLSGADARPRHRGLSHHTVTLLGRLTRSRCTVAVPLAGGETRSLLAALRESGVAHAHRLVLADGEPGLALLVRCGVPVTTMGRTIDEDRLAFLAGAAAGRVAAALTGSAGAPAGGAGGHCSAPAAIEGEANDEPELTT